MYLGRNIDVVKKKSKQNNPEQRTKNATNTEFAGELSAVDKVKASNSKKGQPQRSKQ
ncbi:glycogen biosynthesis protein GlgD [Bacillus sp. EAC]|uniref:glycogen biosynthesis protein GlgD n=1 Tax=Bacillus sp. EAC TaxID=1978338 RepID=UPI000B436DE8|nr:glycogen biosynthesis protein GlgD [Bacillus sp. EAC]